MYSPVLAYILPQTIQTIRICVSSLSLLYGPPFTPKYLPGNLLLTPLIFFIQHATAYYRRKPSSRNRPAVRQGGGSAKQNHLRLHPLSGSMTDLSRRVELLLSILRLRAIDLELDHSLPCRTAGLYGSKKHLVGRHPVQKTKKIVDSP